VRKGRAPGFNIPGELSGTIISASGKEAVFNYHFPIFLWIRIALRSTHSLALLSRGVWQAAVIIQ
jgi:hypothetical protein